MSRSTEVAGIDLGTNTTRIYVEGRGLVAQEPSLVALSGGRIVAIGHQALDMLGRAPASVSVTRPVQGGVIAHLGAAQAMLRNLLRRCCGRRWLRRPIACISVAHAATAVERSAVLHAAKAARVGQVIAVPAPVAAAHGAGLELATVAGQFIIDIGAGKTEAAVISQGRIAAGGFVRIGGRDMDMAISRQIRRSYNLEIGERTAEGLKIAIGSAYPLPSETSASAKGRDAVSGLPRSIEISSDEVREALAESVATIAECAQSVLCAAPPELAADIAENGVTLIGGGALLRGLDRLIQAHTDVPVHLAHDPLQCIAVGAGRYLDLARKLSAGAPAVDADPGSAPPDQ
ncbi:MAG: rod shape-determining protein [Armatimonadota bacterium]